MKKAKQTELVIFTHCREKVKLRGDFDRETLWASLDETAQIFARDKSVISRHFSNIFKEGELDKSSVVAKYATTAADGKTYQVEYYNLDAIISVGYRVNSAVATRFRQWATKTPRQHITQGYTINPSRIAASYGQFMEVVGTFRIAGLTA